MKIGILTSSRADYSQYLPLLKVLKSDSFFTPMILAFGTHLSEKYGYTIQNIHADGFEVTYKVETYIDGSNPKDVCLSMSKTIDGFSSIWAKEKFDFLVALGDRYEMFAACASAVPFNIPIAHIHGGEKTEGALDEAFRHAITQMSTIHFTSTEKYKVRVTEMLGRAEGVYNTGALSIDNLKHLQLLNKTDFQKQFGINLEKPTILITFHPETKSYENNSKYADELLSALSEIKNYQLVITMPNADTMGNIIREKLNAFISQHENAFGVESFGTVGYLSCMKHCSMMLGNTSSGFLEASFFPTKVINIGNRQKGRIVTPNIINCNINHNEILAAVRKAEMLELPSTIDLYGSGNSAAKMTEILKKYHESI
jgi:GDP/UDP-N,N'-diacetylbacillosamine 2-epimerase (hydrolysing)